MKFQHLQVGQRFEYQGEIYVKSSPMVANHCETGAAKMIPRSAMLKPVDMAPAEKTTAAEMPHLDATAVVQAIRDFEQQYREALTASGLDPEQQAALARHFASGRERFMERLGLKD